MLYCSSISIIIFYAPVSNRPKKKQKIEEKTLLDLGESQPAVSGQNDKQC